MLTFPPPHALPPTVTTCLNEALGHLYWRYDNVEDVNEQALAGALLVELSVAFAPFTRSAPLGSRHVWDTEYRRAGPGIKNLKVLDAIPTYPRSTRAIVPDLILHRPYLARHARKATLGQGPNNLAMIEVKKSPLCGLFEDWAKLALMTDAVDEIQMFGTRLRRGQDVDRMGHPDATLVRPKDTGLDRYELGLSVNLWRDHADVHLFHLGMSDEPTLDRFDPQAWRATCTPPAPAGTAR